MADTLNAPQIAARAQVLRRRAERLARDASLPCSKAAARAALRDVAEAETWLRQPDAPNRPHILGIAVTELNFAEHWLSLIEEDSPTDAS